VLVIYSKSVIDTRQSPSNAEADILGVIRNANSGLDLEGKHVSIFGAGAPSERPDGVGSIPIVASICSKKRHPQGQSQEQGSEVEADSRPRVTLDLHTGEAPIRTTYLDATLGDLGLAELAMEGVLNLFAVTRQESSLPSPKEMGKDSIYLQAEHWVSLT